MKFEQVASSSILNQCLRAGAAAGLGKSAVLAQALDEGRRADRRIARVDAAIDGPALWRELADRLEGHPSTPTGEGRAANWLRLERAVRVCVLQGRRVVLAVDGCETLDLDSRRDLERLGRIAGATAILAWRDDPDDEPPHEPGPWTLEIRLAPLTFSDAREYLDGKLAAAGVGDALFTRRAAVRLHAASRGVPRGLDRLASLALAAAAARGLEAVSSEIVEGVSGECRVPPG